MLYSVVCVCVCVWYINAACILNLFSCPEIQTAGLNLTFKSYQFIFIAFVRRLSSLRALFINGQHISDIAVVRNDIDFLVSPDAWPSSNYCKLISTLSRESATSHLGDTAATLNRCSNHTVDKGHVTFYLTWKVQCGRNFCIWWINKMVTGGPKSWMRAVMINMVYFSSTLYTTRKNFTIIVSSYITWITY